MTPTKQILLVLVARTALLVALVAFGALFYFAVTVGLRHDNALQSRKYSVSAPESLQTSAIANDVWFWYAADGIEPIAIQRVDYEEGAIVGRRPWGYFLYYKGRVRNPELQERIRSIVSTPHLTEPSLPPWASHVPDWWSPSDRLSTDAIPELKRLSTLLYVELLPTDVILYWLHEPYEGRI